MEGQPKRPRTPEAEAEASGLSIGGLALSDSERVIVEEEVALLAELALGPPGVRQPLDSDPVRLFAPAQSSIHRSWDPPGFGELRELRDPEDHLVNACKLRFPLDGVEPPLEDDLDAAISKLCEIGPADGRVAEFRRERLERLSESALRLNPISARLRALRPQHVAWAGGDSANIAFIYALGQAMRWPDTEFVGDQFLRGVSIVGIGREVHLWKKKDPKKWAQQKAETTPLRMFWRQLARITGKAKRVVLHRFERNQATEDGRLRNQILFDNSMQEVKDGLSAGPFTMSQLVERHGYGKFACVPRSVVEQNGKWRNVDESQDINDAYAFPETTGMMPPWWPAAVGRRFYFESRRRGWADTRLDIGGSCDDETAAYRATPPRTPQLTYALVVDPATGHLVAFQPRGLNFGLEAAVAMYSRKPKFLVAVARRFLAAVLDNYLDDIPGVEPVWSRGGRQSAFGPYLPGREFPSSSQAMLWAVVGLTGAATLAPLKSAPWSTILTCTGITFDFRNAHRNGEVSLRVKDTTRLKLLSMIDTCVGSGCVTAKEASSLVGKFRWVACLGKIGLAATQPLVQLARMPKGSTAVLSEDRALGSSVEFIASLLRGGLPAVVYKGAIDSKHPALVYSDAMWRPRPPLLWGVGRVAFVVLSRDNAGGLGEVFYSEVDVPQGVLRRIHSLRAQLSFICALEEIATSGAYACPELVRVFFRRDVIHFADNQAANGAAVKGYSKVPDLARVVSAMHVNIAKLQARWWLSFVKSESNVADAPSRGDLSWLQHAGATRLAFRFPSLEGWDR